MINLLKKAKLKLRFILFFTIISTFTWAQENNYTIKGNITDKSSGLSLEGVVIQIRGSNAEAISDGDGNYTLNATLSEGNYSITANYLDYLSQTKKITLGSELNLNIDFQISDDLIDLDEVVTTGTGGSVEKRTLGNAISSINVEDLQNTAATAIDQAIAGKISGALVQQNSGDPAGGISIRLRGASTILGNSDPLYIIDGVVIDNSSNNLIDLGGNSQNRLVDINPNDIERMEILKGAAAAAIYGSRASNGVVQIFTKKGKVGAPVFNLSSNVKANFLRKQIDYNTVPLAWEKPLDNNDLNKVEATRYNYQDDFFETSYGVENNLSVRGGTEKTRYYFSASQFDNGGIIKNSRFSRIGLKGNVSQEAFGWLKINTSLNYTRSSSEDIPNGGINGAYGAITGFIFSDNSVNPNPDESGVYPVTSLLVPRTNPLEAVNRFDFGQKTNRFISSVGLNADIAKGLTASYTLGMDYYNQSGTAFIPLNNTSPEVNGFARRSDVNSFQYNSDLNFVYQKELSDVIESTSTLGGSWQYEEKDYVGITASGLVPVVETATSGSIRDQGESRSQISYWGGFFQQSFGFYNKLYLNGAIRMDGASSFGEDERSQVYGKASISYVISDEDFWKDNLQNTVNTLKLRASWGQAGNLTALGAYQRFTNFVPSTYINTPSLIPSTARGNLNVSPERQTEIEFGFDAAFLNNRIGLEFTYYQQDVTDLLLARELAPSTGYGTRIENVGNLENKGIEILFRATPVKSDNLSWDITSTFSNNKNKVTKVAGGGQFSLPGSFSSNYVIEGESLGVFYRQFYAREDNGDIALNEKGFPYRGVTEDGSSYKVIGDPNPAWFGSLINEVKFHDFGFRFQLDAVQDFDVFNWNRRLMDNVIFGGGAKVGRELAGELPKGYGRAEANIFEAFVEDGSFVKLREISLTYNLDNPFKGIDNATFSLIGRNLYSWDSYSGWDPEINTAGQSNGVRGFDFAAVPIPATVQFGINLTF